MGKYIILLTMAVAAGSMTLTHQSKQTSLDTDRRQADRQQKVIARQVARSGYNAVLAQARQEERGGKKVKEIVDAVGTVTGTYQGGVYKAWLTQISPTAYRATGTGTFQAVTHKIRVPHSQNIVPEPPTVVRESELQVEFKQSMAGYCSAIYLQRFVPHGSNGHSKNKKNKHGIDRSNRGKSKKHEDHTDRDDDGEIEDDETRGGGNASIKYKKLPPELVFAPGNNRNGTATTFEKVLSPGTRLNFILAVDADGHCEARNDTTLTTKDASYDYTRPSFVESIGSMSEMHEAPYALTQEKPGEPGTWRVAFEDLIFSEDRLWDIKENGYDGNGWLLDGLGYWLLKDYGNRPDFSDQVVEVKIVPLEKSGEGDGDDLLSSIDEDGD